MSFVGAAFELELFAYGKTGDWTQFTVIRQDVILKIAEIVEGAGARFAAPTQLTYQVKQRCQRRRDEGIGARCVNDHRDSVRFPEKAERKDYRSATIRNTKYERKRSLPCPHGLDIPRYTRSIPGFGFCVSLKTETLIDLRSVPATEWDATCQVRFRCRLVDRGFGTKPCGESELPIRTGSDGLLSAKHCLSFRPEDNVGCPYCIRRYVVDQHLGGPEGLAICPARTRQARHELILDFVPTM